MSEPALPRPPRRHRLLGWTNLGPLAFGIGSVVGVSVIGVPSETDVLFVWVIIGLAGFSLSDLRGFARGVVRD